MSIPHSAHIPAGSKVLVLAEKPSMARDLAAVLGGGSKSQGHIPFDSGWITWAVGHLLQLSSPSSYADEPWKVWAWEGLPMFPDNFSFLYEVKPSSPGQPSFESHLNHIKSLYRQADIVVNACDAGREGELICWEILRYCGWGATLAPGVPGPKPLLRLWAQSNTPDGLVEAWSNLFPIEERLGLPLAAYCRSEADWLLGMNGSRAVTLAFPAPAVVVKNKKRRGVWSLGRVQTPVLALIADRDATIESFVPQPFYEVRLTFQGQDSDFEAALVVPSGAEPFHTDPDKPGDPASQKAFLRREQALEALDGVLSSRPSPWDVSETSKEGVENPPLLFSLTDLQKWCNVQWGWDAKRTLQAAQDGYETDKSLTYPRTDSAFLPQDSKSKMDSVHQAIADFLKNEVSSFPQELSLPSVSPRASFLFDDKKLTDHYAIVPTGVIPGDLDSDSGKVWLAVVRRFFTAFSAPARFSQLRRDLSFGEFRAFCSGKVYLSRGWLDVDDCLVAITSSSPRSLPNSLPPCGSSVPLLDGGLHEGKTTPPKRLTEATLLGLMENIHTKIDSSEADLREAIAARGLGTPATRAAIIETLLLRGYIERVRKGGSVHLRSTSSGQQLLSNLRGAGLDFLTSPVLTAEWETRLLDMEKSSGPDRMEFLSGLAAEIESVIGTLSKVAASSGGTSPLVDLDVPCPVSGKPIRDGGSYWILSGFPEKRFFKTIAGRPFTLEEVLSVIGGESTVFEGFVSKAGKLFSAGLKFDPETAKFSFVFPEREPSSETSVVCPTSGSLVLDAGGFWEFPGYPGVRFWKTIASKPMSAEDYVSVLKGEKKAFSGFVSKKSGKEFSAALVFKGGQVSFDFGAASVSGPSSPRLTGPGARSKFKPDTKKKRTF